MRPQSVSVCPAWPTGVEAPDASADGAAEAGAVDAGLDGDDGAPGLHAAIRRPAARPIPGASRDARRDCGSVTRSSRSHGHRSPGRGRTPPPPMRRGPAAVDEPLTSSSGRSARRPSRSRAAGSSRGPQAPRRCLICQLRPAWAARIAGKSPMISSIARPTMAPIRRIGTTSWRRRACMPVRRRLDGSCFIANDRTFVL